MAFSSLLPLIAKGTPSPIEIALTGFQAGAQMMPAIQQARLQPLLTQARITALPYQAAGSYLGGLGRMGQMKRNARKPKKNEKIKEELENEEECTEAKKES